MIKMLHQPLNEKNQVRLGFILQSVLLAGVDTTSVWTFSFIIMLMEAVRNCDVNHRRFMLVGRVSPEVGHDFG